MRSDWEVVIGLETHAQLNTASKIFSGASTAFGAEPNVQASAVDIALPGVLPVLNKGAVERAIRFGLAIGAEVAPRSVFARKNYFYPDLPKGYQISQFELPVVQGGEITIQVGEGDKAYSKVVHLTRAHLEEDAGKSLHEDFQGSSGIDLNRAGTPLLEIVTEPDMSSSAEAVAYAKALHALVQWIDICDGNMQEGSFRCDANVSVRRKGEPLGTRREIKNLNSFRFLQQAIEYEIQWQIETLEDGGRIQQATVLFDPDTGETRVMRTKEDAHDYRYFPDPDLLPLEIDAEWKAQVAATMPELPEAMRARFEYDYILTQYDATTLTATLAIAKYFEDCVAATGLPPVPGPIEGKGNISKPEPFVAKLCANWVMGELAARLNKAELEIAASPVSAAQLAGLIARIADNTLSNNIAKKVFEALWNGEGGSADEIIEKQGLKQVTDASAIEPIIDEVIANNAQNVAEYKAGKEKAFNALVGQVMKASKGKASPAQVNELLKKKLG
ncbi:MAG: Asp-tRNA(Asn)/Glu-tRNA(Gln) amidotransferase GatCAB subunit B [Candidatus Dactylopiibacterium carminicum]|uniref:Aspartyl/glutamyl-tRNA(Asn/Gln) amidotransferase subunit B n=1 Tax=Candidatus Dactylopiibacterium carminicum TaxID=857335 RepID=A0A272EVL0_9RHOO|nr:Asp-tRNA(Asn)/Glu-tRNA(Gln) amidotransferase subunit GatB [Candidatus Dactylopiibacterium carminicum]KAF7599918.1 Asp-tRNA(Asn)/Glu-tRNA(Gln) amidotransferase subunit GatB [Candidatus Dactylopiibacterium carminicum]PAS94144.1 MAG: Asp-tRNA(Asn)/Glu-tRNA(Gln) amidotransferase GatCAB subunit B [Candidatus Dactylopiibacterium carminicum]PAS96787.1 MAG: Asp-tRNA(Asn)/Glu-tRNA(Gln) amidotransferase GatCAB subunit B [Candidatus Dactylopiibacterium carminicum]PAS99919.1 MAG: aspartyl/glutamyl-tRNA 